jgi:shikimate kinase
VASVFLIGFMGAGKSTVGEKLAASLGWAFYDLDNEIERRTGQTIPQIFETSGEAEFRRVELEALRELLAGQKKETIYALGGGAIESPDLWQLIANHVTVYLDGDFDFLVNRCVSEGDTRPVLRDPEQARIRYMRRQPLYRRASFTVRVHEGEHCRSPQELAEEVRNLLRHVCLNAGL